MCFKIFVDLIMICDCLRKIKYDEHVKPGKNSILFLKKGKTVISVENQEIF